MEIFCRFFTQKKKEELTDLPYKKTDFPHSPFHTNTIQIDGSNKSIHKR